MTSEPLRGPWVAVLRDRYGDMYEHAEDFDDDDEGFGAIIAVLRGTAAPQPGATKVPYHYNCGDVLYELGDVEHDDEDPSVSIAARWEQAKAVAAALNAVSDPRLTEAIDVLRVAASHRGGGVVGPDLAVVLLSALGQMGVTWPDGEPGQREQEEVGLDA